MFGVAFDWDDVNRKHLAAHQVTVSEFEEVLRNNPIDLDFSVVNGEDRYRSAGLTLSGRLLTVAWTIRGDRVRAITAFPATATTRRKFLEKLR